MRKNKLFMPLITMATIGAIAPITMLASCSTPTVEPKVTKLSVNAEGAKTEYYYGEKIDRTGLVITATYEDNSSKTIDFNKCEFSPSLETPLTTNDETVTIKFGGQEATYDIIVWEDLLNYAWREDVKEGSGKINNPTATDYYFTASNVVANIKDDVFWHLSKYARAINSLLYLEEYGKEIVPSIQEYVTAALKLILGEKFDYIGYLLTASGRVTNVELNEYDAEKHVAYISADIIMNLESKMVDRSIEGKLTNNGFVTIYSIHHLKYIPYSIQYNPDEKWLSYPIRDMIITTGTKLDDHKYKDQWSLSRDWHTAWVDGNKEIGSDSQQGGPKIWNRQSPVDVSEGIAGDPVDFISWGAYYLENYTN